MKYIFPASVMANTFAMTGVMIVLSFAGKSDIAADIGIVHGVTVALFYAFSANARNMILNPSSGVSSRTILASRLLLLLPVGVVSFLLSTQVAGVDMQLAFGLVLRRCAEWIAEVYVSEVELRNESKSAAKFFVLQTVLTSAVVVWVLADVLPPLPVLIVWGASPLWFCSNLLYQRSLIGSVAERTWLKQLPHFGSTAVIGVSVFVFRLLLLLLVGKAVAGDLYTVFAIGGLLGTVFAQAIGPTLILQEARGAGRRLPAWLKSAVVLSLVSGVALVGMASVRPDQLLWTGKSSFFWMGMGLSLIGGVVMVVAQLERLILLQRHADKDVFGPDVFANILLIASIPYGYYLFGINAMAGLYLISSLLSLIAYSSAVRGIDLWALRFPSWVNPVKGFIVLFLIIPIFFQLSGEIFRDPENSFKAGGILTRLPIPVSVFACYGGIILLGRFEQAHKALTVIFFTFTLMLASSILLTHEQASQEQAKLILLIQFVLPMFALVLGQQFVTTDRAKSVLAPVLLFTLCIMVPAELVATWARGQLFLSPYVYFFSVYQLYQYVSAMFATVYVLALFSLWDESRYRFVLLTLSVPVSIFVAAAMSTLAAGALIAGALGFAAHRLLSGRGLRHVLILILSICLSLFSYLLIIKKTSTFADKYQEVTVENLELPKNMAHRVEYWRFYSTEVFKNVEVAALGHAVPPDRAQYPSAHNYYLDFAYNFGLLALLPLLGLIGITLNMVYRNWSAIVTSPPLLGLVSVVLFLLLVDNSLKVGMRQPYSGILTFFLWGLLLTELSRRSRNVDSLSSL
jgi:hypothetical protein